MRTVALVAFVLLATSTLALAQGAKPGVLKPGAAPAPPPPTSQVGAARAQMTGAVLDARDLLAARDKIAMDAGERLGPSVKTVLGPSAAAFQAEIDACASKGPEARCLEDLVVSLRNRKALFAKSGVDVAAERTKLGKDLALDVGGATDPGTPPEDLGLTWAADTATATAAPLGNVARTQALGPFSLFARSGDAIAFDAKTGGVRFACNSLMVGACYKRAIVGGAFEVPAGMKRGLLRVQLGVNASVSTVAFLAYANAEVKLTAFVGDVSSPSCKVEQRIVQSVAPVFGGGARRFDRDVWLACPFDASTPGRRAFSVQTETWAGSGGVGSAASALVASAYRNAAVDFSPSAF